MNSSEIIMFPGGDGSNDYGWFDWLKAELGKEGVNSFVTQSKIVSPSKRAEYLLALNALNSHSVLVGHSFGALAAIKMMEMDTAQTVRGMLLVDPSVKDAFTEPWPEEDEHRIPYLESWDWKMNFAKVRERVGKIIILSDKESGRNLKNWEMVHRNLYAAELGAELRLVEAAQKHFSAKEEPLVRQAVFDIIEKSDNR